MIVLCSKEDAAKLGDAIEALLAAQRRLEELLCPRSYPTHIALGLPVVTRKGIPMNYELLNDAVATFPIVTTNAAGVAEPAPTGDVFTVVSSNPASLNAVIGQTASGAPAVVLNGLVQASPGLTATVSDSAGLQSFVLTVDIVADITPKNISLDVADVTIASQPVPTAPGP